MQRMNVKIWTAGILGLLFSWPASAAESLVTADTVFEQTGEPFIQQISEECVEAAPCCTEGGCCADECGGMSLFFGVEATYLRPFISGGSSTVTVNGTTRSSNTAEDFYAAPRIWLGAGLKNTPLFVQLQYWQLDGSSSDAFVGAVPGGTFGSTMGTLNARTFDFEAGTFFCLDRINTNGKFTFGGRYVDVSQSSNIFATQQIAPGIFTDASAFGSSGFTGTGLTFSTQLWKQIGCSNWSLFGGTRFSWMWGDQSGSAISTANSLFAPASATGLNGAIGSSDSTLYIAELQLGTQWQRRIQCLNADAFLRLAIEYQYWNTDANGAGAASFATAGPLSSTAVARTGALDMSLLGLAVGTGLTW